MPRPEHSKTGALSLIGKKAPDICCVFELSSQIDRRVGEVGQAPGKGRNRRSVKVALVKGPITGDFATRILDDFDFVELLQPVVPTTRSVIIGAGLGHGLQSLEYDR